MAACVKVIFKYGVINIFLFKSHQKKIKVYVKYVVTEAF